MKLPAKSVVKTTPYLAKKLHNHSLERKEKRHALSTRIVLSNRNLACITELATAGSLASIMCKSIPKVLITTRQLVCHLFL